MNTQPKVSVLIPTYNCAQYLDECIQSVLNQTYTDFELIIADNTSTDNTREVVAKYLTDKRVHYVFNPVNLGLIGNLNKLLDLAQGEYLKFLCADDLLHPQLLEKFVPVMEKHPGVVLVSSHYETFGDETAVCRQPLEGLHNGRKIIIDTLKNGNWLGFPSNVLLRKSACRGLKFNLYPWVTDWDYYVRILKKGDGYIVPEVLSYLRDHDNQLSDRNRKHYAHYMERYDFYTQFRKNTEYQIDLPKETLNNLIRNQALFCGITLRKALPGFHRKEKRKIIRKSFGILWKEGVVLQSVFTPGSKMLSRNSAG